MVQIDFVSRQYLNCTTKRVQYIPTRSNSVLLYLNFRTSNLADSEVTGRATSGHFQGMITDFNLFDEKFVKIDAK